MIDKLYKKDSLIYLAHELDKEILESLASMPVLEIKPNELDFSDFKLIGVDLAFRQDMTYINGVLVTNEEE